MIVDVARIGKRTLDGNVLSIVNRTYRSSIVLTDEQAARWTTYLRGGRKMPEIPINPMDLPTETEPMDDAATYKGTISNVGGSAFDKNSHEYFGIQVEISEPDEWKGRKVGDNYIALPFPVTPDMDGKARRRALESGVRLGRLCRSAKFNPGARKWNTDELLGSEITFTVKNEEYQGRLIPKINDYLI